MKAANYLSSVRRLLCLGAHSDDIEIGAGAAVLNVIGRSPGVEVLWCVFSGDERRHSEAAASAADFCEGSGAFSTRLEVFRDGFFPSVQVQIKERFEALKAFEPDLVLTHYRDDRHQDHRVISELTWNTFRSHQILEYEIPKWDGDLIRPNLYIPVEDAMATRKVQLLMRHFGSQRAKHWFDEETFRGLMRLRGLESNARYAEGFVARKWVIA